MKKALLLALSLVMVLSLAACSSDAAGDNPATENDNSGTEPAYVTINTWGADKVFTPLEVPFDPQRVAVMDLAVLDILDNLGLGDRVVGVSKGSSIDYLQSYVTDDALLNLGTIKEANFEAVMECDPDVIFIGGRLSASYAELSKIAPVVYLPTSDDGVVATVASNANIIAAMFGKEAEVSSLLAAYDARIGALADFADGKTAIVGMVNNGGFGVLGNDGRCSIIGVEIGFANLSDSELTSTHGNESSFELLVAVDPDYIFAMDRDAAIGTEGAQLAAEVLDNELVHMTSAYQNGNVIVLEHSNVWYTAEGGITALDIMLSDLEKALF